MNARAVWDKLELVSVEVKDSDSEQGQSVKKGKLRKRDARVIVETVVQEGESRILPLFWLGRQRKLTLLSHRLAQPCWRTTWCRYSLYCRCVSPAT